MYKLILADDEADVREGVLHEIDWASIGFEVVDRAENGREALEMAERWRPDVLVTDIQMPFMDGLALSEKVRGLLPGTKIIILTGYDEFEYARKAISLGIEEFVLKPFSADELRQALLKVKAQLDEERRQRENLDSLKEHYRRSLPLLREVFLGSLLTRELTERDIREKLESYDLPLADCRHLTAAIHPDLPPDAEDAQLLGFAARNIAEEIAARHSLGHVFQHGGHTVLLASGALASTAQEELRQRTMKALEEMRESVEKYLKFTVTIGVGMPADRLRDVRYSYEGALAALDYRLLLGTNRVIPIGDVEARETNPFRYDELSEQELVRCLKFGTEEELAAILDKQFEAVMNAGPNAALSGAQQLLLRVVSTLSKLAQDTGKDAQELLGAGSNVLGELARLQNVNEAKEWTLAACRHAMTRIAADRQTSYNSLVEQAKAYTKTNFADSELSITQVCAHLHISAGYFSSIFKKETKTTYVAYLLQLRMEEAKELLATTDLKAFEIAEKVGYADPNYFSFSFKKYVGQSPKDYRAGRAKGESP